MISAPWPADEAERLAALHKLNMLDTPPDPELDELVALACRQLRTPMALVTLVDERRQWFKARCGLAVTETPREVAFCAHAICGDDLFIVEDALRDLRFADNPLVTGEPHIRFYAGAPIFSPNGYRVGTLCVLDRQPRTLDEQGRGLLRSLGDIAAWELARQRWMAKPELLNFRH